MRKAQTRAILANAVAELSRAIDGARTAAQAQAECEAIIGSAAYGELPGYAASHLRGYLARALEAYRFTSQES